MKFNKQQKDNIIKMSNQEAKALIRIVDIWLKSNDGFIPTYETEPIKAFADFYNGIKNLTEIKGGE